MKKPAKTNSWLITVPLVAVAGGYLYFFFMPTSNAIAELRDELKTKRTFIETSSNLRVATELADNELSKTRRYNEAWKAAAPTQATLARLLGDINQLAKNAGVEISAFTPQTPVLSETFRRVPVNVEVLGTSKALLSFLGDVETLPPVIWIDTFEVEATGEHRQTIKAQLKLVIFASNPEKSN